MQPSIRHVLVGAVRTSLNRRNFRFVSGNGTRILHIPAKYRSTVVVTERIFEFKDEVRAFLTIEGLEHADLFADDDLL